MRIRASISFLSLSSGIVPFIAISFRKRGGRATVAASIALVSQGRHSLSSYSRNGENSPQPCATVEELRELKAKIKIPLRIAADEIIRKAADPFAVDLTESDLSVDDCVFCNV